MEIVDRIDSDHQPVVVWLKGRRNKKVRRSRARREGGRGVWDEEGREEFRENLGEIRIGEGRLEEEMGGIEKRIREAIKKVEEKRDIGRGKRRGWWDEECKEVKRTARKALKEWMREKGERREYRRKRKEYKELCERKKEEENKKLEKEAEEANTEEKVWRVVNAERKKRKRINGEIEMRQWEEYFKTLLGGVENKVIWGEKRGERKGEEKEIEREEIRRAISKVKDGKAAGEDGIPNEVWKYGGVELERWIGEVCNKIWKGEGWPEGWKEGMIVPIVKKGQGGSVEEYRGVTIMPTLYKIYASVLADRLRDEIKEKEILSPTQTGFRKGMGTIDSVYVLNYLINRQLKRKGRKLIALFVDMKAAYDSVDRGILIEAMKKKGIREGLIERVDEIMRETTSR
ncbi:PREDICTED: RNA-directed DNA polymerase from mobile element jockey-like, partial [Vollenhovia emeryi]|uniref:RNA-directed DNA polymerase from mobile element jockey-like n=1 Tax=Vollenhovia emeryi TaxID=411798 RepID=UPI0005F54F41